MTQELIERLRALNWKAAVPDDIQSEVRMQFNEALAGGPNMNGDAGPTLTPNHALDCIWAAERIQSQSARIAELEESVVELWHESEAGRKELHEYLGMTWEQYQIWANPTVSLTKDSTSAR